MNTEQAKRNMEEMNHKGQDQAKHKEEREQAGNQREGAKRGYKMSGLMRVMLTAGVALMVLRFVRRRSRKG